ncbi:phenoloxidase-activating factor 3-like [Aricia agestis]|uniref:phenoloxidase-activating factor 3-like n=1 Tax=Aricia agestis TaxID=91739 RepID=UPI001C20C266|nr:phenoloxidase-activating factor 3-like [Aricia agestis]
MYLQGQAQLRYDPCDLGVLYFDKVTDILWKGTVNLGLYPYLNDAQIEINFKDPLIFYGFSQQSKMIVNNRWREYILVPKGKLPTRYHFYFSINSTVAVEKPTVTKFTLNNVLLCGEHIKKNSTPTDSRQPGNFQCGRRSLNHSELVTVRADAKAGDWPWHVAVLIRDLQNSSIAMYQCGGNIVSRTAVLTAGHCLFTGNKTVPTNRLIIQAGTSNLWDLKEIGRQILTVERVVIHPSYVLEQATSDLAILFVNTLVFTEYVQPICVWGPLYDKRILYGQQAVVAGFGLTEQNVMSDRLRSSYTIVQPDKVCVATAPTLYSSLLNEFTFCAGDGNSGTSPLNGDSGGGLAVAVTHIDDRISWFLRGILSKCVIPQGKKLCDPKYFVVYTDVAPHYGWIHHHIAG